MTPTEKRTILRAFWRKGRQTFVPLTQDELDDATGGRFSVHRGILVRGGLIKTQDYSRNGEFTAICHVTESGKREIGVGPEKRRRLTAKPPEAATRDLASRALR